MGYNIQFIISLIIYIITETCAEDQVPLYTNLDAAEIASKYGYHSESHTVTTVDGYILTVHRISLSPYKRGRPVLMVHGILCSSADWVNMGPKRSLGLIIADEGFDVWLLNLRGNTYSKRHCEVSEVKEDNKQYWNFSFHEMGLNDLPAAIDYILKTTGRSKLSYVGHSMGTTVFYVMCSLLPQYQHKVLHMISLAPVAYLNHIRGILLVASKLAFDFMDVLNNEIHTYEIGSNKGWLRNLGFVQCSGTMLRMFKHICALSVFSATGFNEKGLDLSVLEVIFSSFPAGASTKTLLHYSQLIKSGKFCMYDYGHTENVVHYGLSEPPQYNLTTIKVPIYLIWSHNDYISTSQDIQHLAEKLPNVVINYSIPDKMFNHIDFLWGYSVNKQLYRYVTKILNRYAPQ